MQPEAVQTDNFALFRPTAAAAAVAAWVAELLAPSVKIKLLLVNYLPESLVVTHATTNGIVRWLYAGLIK